MTHLQQYENYHVICMFVWRGAINCTKNIPLYPKIKLYANNCLKSRFKPYFCRRERTATLRFLSSPFFFFFFFFCLFVCFFFFLLVKIFGKLGPLLKKFPGSAPDLIPCSAVRVLNAQVINQYFYLNNSLTLHLGKPIFFAYSGFFTLPLFNHYYYEALL